MLGKVISLLKYLKNRQRTTYIGKLNSIAKSFKEPKDTSEPKLRILMGPSFAIYAPSFIVDRSLYYAFKTRGTEIIPIYCDGLQHIECNYYGGPWGGGKEFSKNCLYCQRMSAQLWQENQNTLRLSEFVSNDEKIHTKNIVNELTYDEALNFVKDNIPFGSFAKNILVNNYLVATPSLIENYQHLLKVHLENLLLVGTAYTHILDKVKPDRVVSNDSFYGMWAILQQLCEQRKIHFYSHWPVTHERVAFAYNDAAMNLNFSKPWNEFKKIPLTANDDNRIAEWLKGKRGLIIDTTKLAGYEVDDPSLSKIEKNKNTIILAANVIWDLAALDKQIIFKDMIDWITKTIEWFNEHKAYQLIIKPHPVEVSPQIPKTTETVANGIASLNTICSSNVILLKPDTNITIHDMLSNFNIRGIAVHTSTVGYEFPAIGVPVITTGKAPYRGYGFTMDPVSPKEYFENLGYLLEREKQSISIDKQTLAKQFIKFYNFHYYAKIGVFQEQGEVSENLDTIIHGDENVFGYIVNSIINGLPINDTNSWIPES